MISSKTWVFLRGLSRESAHWEDFPTQFHNHFPGTRVVLIDLPGNGEHWAKPTPLSLKGLVAAVREDLRHKGYGDQPVCVFALSLGAMVALQWMQDHPEEIDKAVLVNTSLRGLSPFFYRMSIPSLITLLRAFFDRDVKARERRILSVTSQQTEWEESMLRKRAEIYRTRPIRRWNVIRQMLAALSSFDRRRKPKQPLLLLNSLGDLLVHPDCSKAIADAWRVPLKRHAWAGHDLTLDDPEWVLRTVEEWLKGESVDDLPETKRIS